MCVLNSLEWHCVCAAQCREVLCVCTAQSREALRMECQAGHVVCGLYNIIYKILNNVTYSYYTPYLFIADLNYTMQWVPVTTVWRVLRFRIEERPPIRRVAANILNKRSRTVDKGWSSSLGVGRGANNPSP